MDLLSVTYLGNIQYYSKLLYGDPLIDPHEHYVKQSYRNRCEIATANGRASLTVNVIKPGNFSRTATKDVLIDNGKRWRHIHWQAIVSSYGNSPFFEYYAHLFEPHYRRDHKYLVDLDMGLMETILQILGAGNRPDVTDRYIDLRGLAAHHYADYRNAISPKARLHRDDPSFTPVPYWQVFSERYPFEENLSVIDLLFCEGPSAAAILKDCYLGKHKE